MFIPVYMLWIIGLLAAFAVYMVYMNAVFAKAKASGDVRRATEPLMVENYRLRVLLGLQNSRARHLARQYQKGDDLSLVIELLNSETEPFYRDWEIDANVHAANNPFVKGV
ncbi:hypothetical protein ACULTK_003939 [Yersinia enterocolitica]|uniref:hypothetical protein n=1 Tax=Yersinia enterocolitica TaxID=630 RepID=UPI0005E21E72|nr:hypothetical protein [Yersinia enterocolitica]EKN3461452.1 hypothetical protein [Yersinia enterocolitica]EKN3500570.1 hypothetical protein [Yersinia enterocolitica]EKN3850169.1 hypothetical protein [Yersinia enterocolitica]EKN3888052.1 hypothetical protein [Yersinia enterocolitica]EKN3943052.1 hypothetical protein [Yersinia enterocolitica]